MPPTLSTFCALRIYLTGIRGVAEATHPLDMGLRINLAPRRTPSSGHAYCGCESMAGLLRMELFVLRQVSNRDMSCMKRGPDVALCTAALAGIESEDELTSGWTRLLMIAFSQPASLHVLLA